MASPGQPRVLCQETTVHAEEVQPWAMMRAPFASADNPNPEPPKARGRRTHEARCQGVVDGDRGS